MKKIATVYTEFPSKFGIPRQSGLVETGGTIVFEPEFRSADALRGIEEYSHLWIIWGFSEVNQKEWKPTVRPPRLGGNKRVGVFATRSPFRPNPIGLSCVKLEELIQTERDGIVLKVSGVDMMSGTPVYDIKPYLPYVDAYPEARGSFSEEKKKYGLKVEIPEEWISLIPKEKISILKEVLSQDPRPSYQTDSQRVYGMEYAGMEIKFQVNEMRLTVCEVKDIRSNE